MFTGIHETHDSAHLLVVQIAFKQETLNMLHSRPPTHLSSAMPFVGCSTGDCSRPNTCLATPTISGLDISAWACSAPPPPGMALFTPLSDVAKLSARPEMKLASQSRRSPRASAKPLQ